VEALGANTSGAARNLVRLPVDYPGTPEVAEIRVTVPSAVARQQSTTDFAIGLQLVDRWGLHIPGATAHLRLTLEGGAGTVPETVELRPSDDSHTRVFGQVHERGRVYRVRARDAQTGIEAISNPLWLPQSPGDADFGLFWGDLHAHRLEVPRTKLADPRLRSQGPATVEEFYRHARDVVHLDFAALTDHDYALTTDEWRQIQEGAQYFNQPERFVTFLGYEWAWNSDADADHGHRNVLFLHDDMPLVSSSWQGSNTPPALFDVLRRLSRTGGDILSIPHHPARLQGRIWCNWETLDPRFERLIEVYSGWGSSEHAGEPFPILGRSSTPQPAIAGGADAAVDRAAIHEATGHFVQDGLRRGLRLGMVGGSESHDGRAGSAAVHGPGFVKQSPFFYQSGLTGLWARRKTRSALWGALWNRRTIATTGARMLLFFDVDEQPMGQTIETAAPPRRLRVRAHGTGPLSRVVVVRNNVDWHVVERPGWECTFEVDSLPSPQGPCDWYYVRAAQEDGHLAWSSPIWVEAT
jgi:hypothetical protein